MSFMSPDYIKRRASASGSGNYQISPNPIGLIEPVISEGQIVFAEDSNGDEDIVMAGSEYITFSISQV